MLYYKLPSVGKIRILTKERLIAKRRLNNDSLIEDCPAASCSPASGGIPRKEF
jgi:hypothetical protein